MPAHSAVPPRFWRAPGFPGCLGAPGKPWLHEGSLKGHRRTVREAFSTCGPLGLASWLPSKLVNRSDGPSLRSNMFPAHDELVCGGTRGDEGEHPNQNWTLSFPVLPVFSPFACCLPAPITPRRRWLLWPMWVCMAGIGMNGLEIQPSSYKPVVLGRHGPTRENGESTGPTLYVYVTYMSRQHTKHLDCEASLGYKKMPASILTEGRPSARP